MSQPSDLTAVLIAVLLLFGNAFFVGAEFALIAARRTQIEPRAESGSRAARLTLRGMERVSLMMAGAQLGITMCSLGLGALGEPAVAHLIEPLFESAGVPEGLLHPLAFAIALTVVVTLHMVVGEMVPKNIAIAGPERSALLLGPPLYVIVTILKPAIALLNWIANVVLKLLRVEPQEEVASTFTEDEVAGFIAESRREGLLDEDEHELLTGALSFTGSQVDSVVLGLDELSTVDSDVTPARLHELCATTGYSRFPVVDSEGELSAYVHLKDVLVLPEGAEHQPVDRAWLRPLATASPGQSLREALGTMQACGAHMARVVDPDTGRTLGVATLEDVIEELIGDVVDAAQNP